MAHIFWRDSNAATSAEYALILALVGAGLGAAALALGTNVRGSINSAAKDISGPDFAAASSGAAGSGSEAAAPIPTTPNPGAGPAAPNQGSNPGCGKGSGKKTC